MRGGVNPKKRLTDFFQPFGDPETPIYGQTFVTPNATDVKIDSFSF